MNFTELLKRKYPKVDFDRYRFKAGDIIQLEDGSIVLCVASAIDYIRAYTIKRSFKYSRYALYEIPYDELPVYKDSFIPAEYTVNKTLKWRVGDIVRISNGNMLMYLYKEEGHQRFYAWVIESENSYYLHTGIYIENPYREYITT